MDHHIEFKFDPNGKPFRDKEEFEHDRIVSSDTRGQITSYVSAQTASQLHTFFQLSFVVIMLDCCDGIALEQLLPPFHT